MPQLSVKPLEVWRIDFVSMGPFDRVLNEESMKSKADSQAHIDYLHTVEAEFRREHPLIWASTLFGPFIFSGILLGVLFLYCGWQFATRLVTTTALSVWLFGRFIILSGDGVSDYDGALSSFQLFLLITYLDTMLALVFAFHIGFLFRVPYIGPRVSALVTDGHFILDAQPWMRRATFLGLVAFVGFPLAATGSVGGSIFGRLLGLSRPMTFLGIFIGSLLGNGVMYWFSDFIGQWIDKDSWLTRFGGFAVILVIVWILERRYQTLKRRYAEEDALEAKASVLQEPS
jgi:uncharacterized membrane protein